MIDNECSESILADMAALREEISCDFCAIGFVESPGHSLRWPIASGHTNERYLNISERSGRGLSATVLKIGRAMPLSMSELVCSRQLQEYPLLLAENLRSAYAVPLYKGAEPAGVFIAGDRRKRVYRTEERRLIASSADQVAAVLCRTDSYGKMGTKVL